MGEANTRGTAQERREQSLERQLDEAECLVFLSVKDGKLHAGFLPRDENPDQDSPAMIFAAFLSENFKNLAGQAIALHDQYKSERDPAVITDVPRRSVLGPDGNIARSGEDVEIVVPEGRVLQ